MSEMGQEDNLMSEFDQKDHVNGGYVEHGSVIKARKGDGS
jgi:hypothetical protein